jgi:hypothetical protein
LKFPNKQYFGGGGGGWRVVTFTKSVLKSLDWMQMVEKTQSHVCGNLFPVMQAFSASCKGELGLPGAGVSSMPLPLSGLADPYGLFPP